MDHGGKVGHLGTTCSNNVRFDRVLKEAKGTRVLAVTRQGWVALCHSSQAVSCHDGWRRVALLLPALSHPT